MTTMKSYDQVKNHPCLAHHNVFGTISEPLKEMGVTFFGYTALDQASNAYCSGSKYAYAAAYLQHDHVKADVHYRPQFKTKRYHYLFWDFVELQKEASALYQMAAQFNQGHTLTVMRFAEDTTHCFHFSGNLSDCGLNQRYLEKMDLIHTYIDYFDNCLQTIPEVAAIHDYPTQLQQINSCNDRQFTIIHDDPRMMTLPEVAQHELRLKHLSRYYLTADERACLGWLHQGKSAALIAQILGVSRKTIERHISAIKRKYDCYTLYQLGENIASAGLTKLLAS